MRTRRGPSTALPAVVAGLGLAGLLDGIVFHELLQWHHVIDQAEPSADGVFHLGMWVVALAGTLWLGLRPAGTARTVTAGLLLGAGLFHVVDHVVFHLWLQWHHIREGEDALLYDWGFFALGVVLIAAGVAMLRSGRSRRREFSVLRPAVHHRQRG